MGPCRECKCWMTDNGQQGTCCAITSRDSCIYPRDLPDGVKVQIQIDYDVAGAALETAADFGCVLFEAKEVKP